MSTVNKKQLAILRLQGWNRNYFRMPIVEFYHEDKDYAIGFNKKGDIFPTGTTYESMQAAIKMRSDMDAKIKEVEILIDSLYSVQRTNWLRKLQFWK